MTAPTRLADLVDADLLAPLLKGSAPLIKGGTAADSERLPELMREFVRRVEDSADERYHVRFGPENLARDLCGTFAFLYQRKKDESRVRASAVSRPDAGKNTMVEVVLTDQPFVVDTAELFFEFAGLRVLSKVYLTYNAQRDRQGRLVSFDEAAKGGRETLARFELEGALGEEYCRNLEGVLNERLEVARAVVADFRRMVSVLRAVARGFRRALSNVDSGLQQRVVDARELIDWLLDENFILMGLSFYSLPVGDVPQADPERQLGFATVNDEELSYCGSRLRHMYKEDGRLENWALFFKSQEESLIHRAGKIDNVLLRSHDADGKHDGYYHLRGLFTFKAIQTPGSRVPMVRLKLEALRQDLKPHSLGWKSLTNAFNSVPVEFLFESRRAEIAPIIETILRVERDKELRSHMVSDTTDRKALYFLVLPRENYSEDLRRRIASILIDAVGATYSDSRVHIGKFETVLLSFFFTATERFAPFDREALDEQVRLVAGTWEERFYQVLVRELGESAAQIYYDRYSRSFPKGYQLLHSPEEALIDVRQLERVRTGKQSIAFEVLFEERDAEQRVARLRVYLRKQMYLSTILPILDNFGLQIIDQAAFEVSLSPDGEMFIQTFRVAGVDDASHNLIATKGMVLKALREVFEQRVGNDMLHRLTLSLAWEWRDVDLLRSYLHYLRQLGETYTLAFTVNTLEQYPAISQGLLEFYRTRFDPNLDLGISERKKRCAAISDDLRAQLVEVRSSGQDQLVRMFLNLFAATLRTSRYQDRQGRDHSIAFKVNPRRLAVGSEPKPWREIYVHHYGVEGVHIRGGKLARGGIRWSDRVSDYREEVLGLMRTQMVKNALIVPVGAKGGFILRKAPSDPEARRQQADAMYKVFIGALLDITDNVIDGQVVRPEGVVRYDKDDPYFVVAADKGTAHLSDTANAISLSRKFWLGDAFASGGSQGYDHKALGITAKGGWEGVKRHFLEMGIDPDRDPFSVVGIGDMAGDVFGNGMLLSRCIKLVGAFNHMHIFIDPNPDPETSFKERARLFATPRTSWRDYSEQTLSKGGAVYERQSKTVALTPEAQAMLGFDEATQSPEAVIRELLKLKVDLLWNGGIGTYVKATSEDSRDVGDFANHAVRVNAKDVRARVIGEGGNLGVTQAGRVEYALDGGRINTDFVDNSAGVDCSDHEVNLKILFDAEIKSGAMQEGQRNDLLRSLEKDVCEAVLHNNYSQCLMLSLDEVRSRHDPFAFERSIKLLEDRGELARDRDCLPTLKVLRHRQAQSRGLTRPELATLSAHCKMELSKRLLKLPLESIPGIHDTLATYFPQRIIEQLGSRLSDHLLAREIAMTLVANTIIDHAGSPFFIEMERETGGSVERIVRAYLIADEFFQSWGTKERLVALDGEVKINQQYQALIDIEEVVHRAVGWLLTGPERGRLDRIERDREVYRELLMEFSSAVPECLSENGNRTYQADVERFYEAGFPVGLPEQVARAQFLAAGLRIADISHLTGSSISQVMRLYMEIGQSSAILPLVQRCDGAAFDGRWDSLALRVIRNSLLDSLWSLTHRVVKQVGPDTHEDWVGEAIQSLHEESLLEDIELDVRRLGTEDLSISALQVVSARLRSVCGA